MPSDDKTDNDQDDSNKNDIESVVRSTFHSVFTPKPLILADNQREMIQKARKSAVEDMIRKIDEKVSYLIRSDKDVEKMGWSAIA